MTAAKLTDNEDYHDPKILSFRTDPTEAGMALIMYGMSFTIYAP